MSNASGIIKVAKAEVGYHEGRSGGHWNNKQKYSPAVPSLEWSQNQAWCATFVSWCALQAGVTTLYPRTASTDLGARWFKDRGQWSEYPAVGAQVFFGVNGDMNHTGIVYGFDATYIYTIEGNTNASGSREGDGVYLKTRARRDSYVQGYGYPKFTEGIKSADPNPPVPQRKTTPTTPPKKGSTAVADVPNFETRMIESNTRMEEMLRAIGAKTGADIKGALARADKTNKDRRK
ncbi:CHAP domain-containing protein [Nocardioides sp. YR527]|uniref:CHAP domain-containing protein n=1 Tax=Nocardioides sp. YR527 TaxID=1881028 RepID=UPI000886C9F5|nr:CHAP domain-containing protein [Nocardioides sp. YR527]SDL14202.1 CHAP domain-containing protein [Nocardioides sp. YR527]